MKVYFVTQNDYKVKEVKAIMKEYGIKIDKLNLEKDEMKEKPIEQVAVENAEKFARKHNVPVIVEDTGFYFHAYGNFPGSNPKLMYGLLGYKGLMKLLENEQNRGAEFRSAVAFSDGQQTKLIIGKLTGRVSDCVHGEDIDVMPYERIFIADGHEKPLAFLPRAEKNKMSHRAKAFREMADWLNQKHNLKKEEKVQDSLQEDEFPEMHNYEMNGDYY